ncbi:hypothetical protein HID58_013585 [Brassica napus]|uniref:Transcription factor n=2 Tax=Brassica napus TaxID=3708 RepID=A0ABQ8E4V3_BRANA|nr:hypothetical protein HID58_013585 [Brassica napus]CDY32382.1 BnaA03g60680D [Brassica napus]
MTKKRDPLENPPAASSSDDASSSEEEELPVKAPSSSAAQQASDIDSGSETETDSDTEQPPNQRSGKAIVASKKDKSGTKRPSEGTSRDTNSKRAKKIGEDSKKPAFQRLWTEEDEIAVLQGMIDFKNDTGNSPYDDTNAYYDYIKKSISFEVSKNQFMDKLRSLKKKYMGKEKPSFTKPHDHKSYRLCNYIWGPDGMVLVRADEKSDWFENSFLVRGIAAFGVDEHYVKQRWSLVPVETKKRVEEKVKMLRAKEIEFLLQKAKILHEVTSMIAEASKNKPFE